MSYVDNNLNVMDDQLLSNIAHCGWINIGTADQTRQWKKISMGSIKWLSEGGLEACEARGTIGFALQIAGTSIALDSSQWNNMYFSAAEVSRVIGGILEVVPIKAYGSWAALIDAATIAYEKLPIQDQDSLAFQESGLIDCVGAPLPVEVNHLNASEDWEDQVKYGTLRKYSKSGAGFLERVTLEWRSVFAESPALKFIARHEVAKGRLEADALEAAESEADDEDVDDEKREKCRAKVARAVACAIGKAAELPPCLQTHPSDPDDVTEMIMDCIDGAHSQFDGDSAFMRARTGGIVAAAAPTLQLLLGDAHSYSELNSFLVQIASACPKDTVETGTKTLLTVAGITNLERYIEKYDSWADSEATRTMHIRTRVITLINRIDAHIKTGGHARCARRDNPAAPHRPANPACRANPGTRD